MKQIFSAIFLLGMFASAASADLNGWDKLESIECYDSVNFQAYPNFLNPGYHATVAGETLDGGLDVYESATHTYFDLLLNSSNGYWGTLSVSAPLGSKFGCYRQAAGSLNGDAISCTLKRCTPPVSDDD